MALLALATVFSAPDWRAGTDFSPALPTVLSLRGELALAVGVSRAPLDLRAARGGAGTERDPSQH